MKRLLFFFLGIPAAILFLDVGATAGLPPAAEKAILTFTNRTAAAGVTFTHATPITSGDGAQMISGAAAGDFNNDGWQDLFVIGGGLRADALFINQGDGTFLDRAAAFGIDDLHLGSAAAVGDYDNDGWLDLYVTSFGPADSMGPGQHRLYRNNQGLSFTNVAAAAGVNQASPVYVDGLGAGFGDIDLDGDLDLFVAGWRLPGGDPALGNRLFRNNGDGTFTDVTAAAGIVDDGIRGFGPCFVDMTGDRYPELLLAADFGTTRYFINQADGSFLEATAASGANLAWSGMGQAVGDFNNDGHFDWFETAIYDTDNEGRGDGNKLYINQGSGSFSEIAAAAGVADGGWGWGAVAVDLDHDGWQDLAEINGWDLPSYVNERGYIWLNNGDLTFAEVGVAAGFDHKLHGMGLLHLDFDNDGDMDLAATAYNDEFRLYHNELSGTDFHWLRVFLDTSRAPGLAPNGFGSRVEILVDGMRQVREINGCSHYLSQSEISAHFGVGSAGAIDELTVTWPDGTVDRWFNLPADQTLTLRPRFDRKFFPFVGR